MTDRLVITMSAQFPSATIPDDSAITRNAATAGDNTASRHQWLRQQREILLTGWLRVKKSQGLNAIHEVRVAARRLRTVLKAWRKEIHPLHYSELRFDLRNIGRLLAPTREADVRRRLMGKLLRPVPAELTHAANQFLAHLDEARAAERCALRTRMHSDHWQMAMARMQAYIDDDQLLAIPRDGDNKAAAQLQWHEDLRKLLRSCTKKRIPVAKLHTLRIKGKTLRYVGEALCELSGEDLTSSLKTLRQLQDLLGDLHDCLQITDWCHTGQMDPSLLTFFEPRLEQWQQQRQLNLDEYRRGPLKKLIAAPSRLEN